MLLIDHLRRNLFYIFKTEAFCFGARHVNTVYAFFMATNVQSFDPKMNLITIFKLIIIIP
jgi:hypothetical protein